MHDKINEKYQDNTKDSALGKKTSYEQSYNPKLLYQIPRAEKRQEIGIEPDKLPFQGIDLWNHYEVSWLNQKGKPIVAMAEIYYDCASPYIVESKALKLYFNSFNNTKFTSGNDVKEAVQKDLEKIIGSDVHVIINELNQFKNIGILSSFDGECMDFLDVDCDTYVVEPSYLKTGSAIVEEFLYSDLLKSNCLVTNQPDWGSVFIAYKGKEINQEGLLKYIVSFRNHNEFHEQCIERIFVDIMNHCQPESLTVYGRYTRRGGIDINPCRSTEKVNIQDLFFRLVRQ